MSWSPLRGYTLQVNDDAAVSRPSITKTRFRPALPRTFQALSDYPNFRQLWFAMMATSVSQWTAQITYGWLALSLTDSAPFVGVVSFMSGLPFLVVALPAGTYIDKLDRHKILLSAQAGAAILGVVMAVDVLTGSVQPWHLLVAAFFNGSFLSVLNPTMQSVIPAIVGKDGLANSIGLMSSGQNMTRIVGPSLAGLIIGFSSTGFAFLLTAGTLLFAFLLITRVRIPSRTPSVTAKGWTAAFSGLHIIWNRTDLRVLFLLACLPPLLIFPYIQFLNIFARDILEIGAGGLGLLAACSGTGAVIGSLMMASRSIRRGDGHRQIRLILLYSIGVIGIAFSDDLVAYIAAPRRGRHSRWDVYEHQ